MKGIIFDFGGTLDSDGTHWSVIIETAYHGVGISIPHRHFEEAYTFAEKMLEREQIIKPEDNLLQSIQKKIDLEADYLLQTAIVRYFPYSKREAITNMCYERAKQHLGSSQKILNEIRRKLPIALVSNFYGNLPTVLHEFGMAAMFTDVIESASIGIRKPDPDIFKAGIQSLHLPPHDIVVVGDSMENDILPARLCGCETICIGKKRKHILCPSLNTLEELLLFI